MAVFLKIFERCTSKQDSLEVVYIPISHKKQKKDIEVRYSDFYPFITEDFVDNHIASNPKHTTMVVNMYLMKRFLTLVKNSYLTWDEIKAAASTIQSLYQPSLIREFQKTYLQQN